MPGPRSYAMQMHGAAAGQAHAWQGGSVRRDTTNAQHYHWGEGCDGWVLAPGPELLAIEEQMPPGTAEQRHLHMEARQFFYVLDGELTMELEGERHVLPARTGIEITPGQRHQARNDSNGPVRFLVVSSPTTRSDRRDVEGTA